MIALCNRKSVDTLITNGHVLTMDDKFTEFPKGGIAFSNGKIAGIGPTGDLLENFKSDNVINANGSIVMPGFVNGHCHAAMSLFRGYAENVALDDFLRCVWEVEERYLTPETVEVGSYISCAEMALGGVSTFVDMYWHPKATIKAAGEIGVNILSGPVFVGFPGADDLPEWSQRLAFAKEFFDEFRHKPGVFMSLAPHSCYTLNEEQLQELAALSLEYDLPIQIHAAEAASEMELVRTVYHATPIEVLDRTGLLRDGCFIAHGVHLTDEDFSKAVNKNASIIHCPLSNGKTAAGTARITELFMKGVKIGLGTDGPSTANDLDIWKAMRHCTMMQSLKYNDPTSLPDKDVVAMATSTGARAVGIYDHTGSLEIGKQADLMIVSADGLHMRPAYNVYATLVYAAGRDDVSDVFVRGHHIVSDHEITDKGLRSRIASFDRITSAIANGTGV